MERFFSTPLFIRKEQKKALKDFKLSPAITLENWPKDHLIEYLKTKVQKRLTKVVVTGALVSKDKLLVVKRSEKESFLPGVWELPGGKIEFGESLTDALEREFREEVSLTISVKKLIFAFDYVSQKQGKEVHTTEIVFLVELQDKDQLRLSPGHSEFRWIEKVEISLLTGAIWEAAKIALNR